MSTASECAHVANDVLLALELKGQMSKQAIHHVLNLACFLTSNAAGKYDHCKNWSEGAAAARRSWRECKKGSKWPQEHRLIHEHIVPRKWIRDALYALDRPSIEAIQEMLVLSENCIVTVEEDTLLGKNKLKQSIPEGCVLPTGKWQRYRDAGIRVHPSIHPLDGI